MQETQQIEELQSEFISLSEFIPNWTYTNLVGKTHDERGQLESELGICIADGRNCMVGEAHGGEDSYYDKCDACNLMSYGDVLRNKPIRSAAIYANRYPERFMKFKKRLYSHMIDEHPNRMQR